MGLVPSLLAIVLLPVALAEAPAPTPTLPYDGVSAWSGAAALLGGLDHWDYGGGGASELRLGAASARIRDDLAVSARAGSVVEAWSDYPTWLDGHRLEVAAHGVERVGPGGVLSASGSAAQGWTEVAGEGSLRLTGSSSRLWLRAGHAARVGPAVLAHGWAAGLSFRWNPGTSLELSAAADGRRWSEELPPWSLSSTASARWAPGPDVALTVGSGALGAGGEPSAENLAGLPAAGSWVLQGWLGMELRVGPSVALQAEIGAHQASGELPYDRVRALVGVAGSLGRVSARPSVGELAGPVADEVVRFRLEWPDAERVQLAGSFTEWLPVDLRPVGKNLWGLELELPPGEYEYVYLVDGVAVTPPEAWRSRADGFGGDNGVLVVEGSHGW